MKKLLTLLLEAVLTISLAACGGESKQEEEKKETEATLTFTNDDNTTETLTLTEIKKINDDNEIKYNSAYKGRKVVMEGPVYSIEQSGKNAIFTVGAMHGFQFSLDMDKNAGLSTIEKGTNVRVTGYLGKTFVFVYINSASEFEIVSE